MRRGETLKFFWRAKKDETGNEAGQETQPRVTVAEDARPQEASSSSELTAEDTAAKDAGRSAAHEAGTAVAAKSAAADSNVIPLQTIKLTERIAAAAATVANSITVAHEGAKTAGDTAGEILPLAKGPLPGQEEACRLLARALAAPGDGAHVLVLGSSGTGRRTAVLREIDALRQAMPRPPDWIYVATGDRLRAYSLPHGQGTLFLREIRAAMARAAANHERLLAGDDYRLGLEIIDEEFRHKAGTALEHLKRRAESQNIALVKTPEGFVLAPMHEGKVVRSDVFRALPQSLQREVEAKIAGLEGELKNFLDQQPGEDAALTERISAFAREAAARAVKPQFAVVRAAFGEAQAAIDAIEGELIASAGNAITVSEAHAMLQGAGRVRALHDGAGVFPAQIAEDFSASAPIVFAHEISSRALTGEVGSGSAGRLALVSGSLLRANGGFLVVEAWRLAAEPSAWLTLSAALEDGMVRPAPTHGLAIEPDAVPLALKVVLIADQASLNKLEAIDPGLQRHFPHAVRMPQRIACAAMTARDYSSFAAAVAAERSLKPIASAASAALYQFACAQAGTDSDVLIDAHALAALLSDADLESSAAGASQIRAADIKRAAARLAEVSGT